LSLSLLVVAPVALRANIVNNPDFETGDLTDWTFVGSPLTPWSVATTAFGITKAQSGSDFADTQCGGADCITTPNSAIYQDLTTVAGQTYTLTFWYDIGVCNALLPTQCGAVELKVFWGSTTADDIVTTASSYTDPGWVEATVTGLTATSTSTELEFAGEQDSAWLGLDNITVNASSSPEPSTAALFGIALAAAAALRRRRAA
jgi:hypothetical protein